MSIKHPRGECVVFHSSANIAHHTLISCGAWDRISLYYLYLTRSGACRVNSLLAEHLKTTEQYILMNEHRERRAYWTHSTWHVGSVTRLKHLLYTHHFLWFRNTYSTEELVTAEHLLVSGDQITYKHNANTNKLTEHFCLPREQEEYTEWSYVHIVQHKQQQIYGISCKYWTIHVFYSEINVKNTFE